MSEGEILERRAELIAERWRLINLHLSAPADEREAIRQRFEALGAEADRLLVPPAALH